MNLGFVFIPNPINQVLNQKVIQALDYVETNFKLPYKVLSPSQPAYDPQSRYINEINNLVIHQGFYVVLITEREEEPNNDANLHYVRTRWNQDASNFTLQFQKRHLITKNEDMSSFVSTILTKCTNRDLMYIMNDQHFTFRLPDRKAPAFPMKTISHLLHNVGEVTVKPCCNWCTSSELIRMWSWMQEPSKIRFVDSNDAEVFLVINSTNEPVVDLRTIYFTMEANGEQLYKEWLDRHPRLLYKGVHSQSLNFVETHLNPNFTKNINRSKKRQALSAIVSDRDWDEGHKYRLELLHALDKMTTEERGFELDIYGTCVKQQFKNYRGTLPDHNKLQGLLEYQYHFNVENKYIPNYITEKLYDSICCECFTFYVGAPNVVTYFPQGCLQQLSMSVGEAIEQIKTTIGNNTYQKEQTQQAMTIAKQKLTNEYNAANRIVRIVNMKKCLVLCRKDEDTQYTTHFSNIHPLRVPEATVQKFIDVLNTVIQFNLPICVLTNHSIGVPFFEILSFTSGDICIHLNGHKSIDDAMTQSSFMVNPKAAERILFNLQRKQPIFQDVFVQVF